MIALVTALELMVVVADPHRPSRLPIVEPDRRGDPTPRPQSWRRWRGRRSRGSLPLVLELLARELRAGNTIHGAVTVVARSEPEAASLSSVVERVAHGDRLGDVLDGWAVGLSDDDGPLVQAVLRLGLSTGVALADALDRAASTIRARAAFDGEIRAMTAQSRMSAVLIAVAPIGFLLVLSMVDPSGLVLLSSTPLGWFCLVTGIGLDAIGFAWMRNLTRGVAG